MLYAPSEPSLWREFRRLTLSRASCGLIYLDAGYSYAFYDRKRGDLEIDLMGLQRKLEQLERGKTHRIKRN